MSTVIRAIKCPNHIRFPFNSCERGARRRVFLRCSLTDSESTNDVPFPFPNPIIYLLAFPIRDFAPPSRISLSLVLYHLTDKAQVPANHSDQPEFTWNATRITQIYLSLPYSAATQLHSGKLPRGQWLIYSVASYFLLFLSPSFSIAPRALFLPSPSLPNHHPRSCHISPRIHIYSLCPPHCLSISPHLCSFVSASLAVSPISLVSHLPHLRLLPANGSAPEGKGSSSSSPCEGGSRRNEEEEGSQDSTLPTGTRQDGRGSFINSFPSFIHAFPIGIAFIKSLFNWDACETYAIYFGMSNMNL